MNKEQLVASRGGHRSSAKKIVANGFAELENTEKTDTDSMRSKILGVLWDQNEYRFEISVKEIAERGVEIE